VKSSASSTRKKVVVRKLDKGLVKGYVNPNKYLGPSGVEVLDREGRLLGIPLQELKGVFFVRDFKGNPQHLERKLFQSRPKHSGLWVRMTFRDKEVLDGIIPNNLLDLDPGGFSIIPPDAYSNNLKIFIPHGALTAVQVIGVISDVRSRRNSPRGSRKGFRAEDVSGPIDMPPPSKPSATK
jgi:hypothetical protein